jgi:hypothetical protein
MSSALGALVLAGTAFDEFESVCALDNVPAKKRITPMSKAGFRILEIVAGRIMDTVEIVRDSSLCPGFDNSMRLMMPPADAEQRLVIRRKNEQQKRVFR